MTQEGMTATDIATFFGEAPPAASTAMVAAPTPAPAPAPSGGGGGMGGGLLDAIKAGKSLKKADPNEVRKRDRKSVV